MLIQTEEELGQYIQQRLFDLMTETGVFQYTKENVSYVARVLQDIVDKYYRQPTVSSIIQS